MNPSETKPLLNRWVWLTVGAAILLGYSLFFMRAPLTSTIEICGRALSSLVELPADLTNQVLIESLLFFGTVLSWMYAITLGIYHAKLPRPLLWAGLVSGGGLLGFSLLAQVLSWFWPASQINAAALTSAPALFNQVITAAFVAGLVVLMSETQSTPRPVA